MGLNSLCLFAVFRLAHLLPAFDLVEESFSFVSILIIVSIVRHQCFRESRNSVGNVVVAFIISAIGEVHYRPTPPA